MKLLKTGVTCSGALCAVSIGAAIMYAVHALGMPSASRVGASSLELFILNKSNGTEMG